MRLTALRLAIFVLIITFLFSCKREVETYQTEALSDYLPLQSGKYITYRLDSTVFTNFGRSTEVHSYQEKDLIDEQITDNSTDSGYRVFRFLRDTAGLQPWVSAGTYFITPTDKTIKVTDNNLRIIKLVQPIKQGTTWKGNRYLPTEPYSAQYSFNSDDNMADWDFTIDSTNESILLNGKTFTNVINVTSVNETINVPVTDPNAYAAKTYAVDKYAKGIGLIYQELDMWEYQPNTGGTSGYKVGFEVKRTLLDHN